MEAPQVVASQAVPAVGSSVATQAVPAAGSSAVPERASEEAPTTAGAAGGEHALVLRHGGHRAVVSQPARGRGAVVFGPQTQEAAAIDVVSRRLRGRTDRLGAFAQAEVERTRDLERAVLVSFFCNIFFVGARQCTHWV